MSDTLLINDSDNFRQVLAEILHTHFPLIGVQGAGCPERALSEIEQLRPGLIAIDIELPAENGQEVTRKIKLVYEDIVIDITTSCSLSEYRQPSIHKMAAYTLSMSDQQSSENVSVQFKEPLASKSFD